MSRRALRGPAPAASVSSQVACAQLSSRNFLQWLIRPGMARDPPNTREKPCRLRPYLPL